MTPSSRSTIAAIATPPGPAERGILRVSGPRAAELVEATVRAASPAFDPRLSRQLLRGHFDDGRGLQPVRCLWMRSPHSFTREDVAEFHLPGAEPLLACALGRLLTLGAMAARPGEFTRRAFLGGRLDLSRAEGVLALTEAGNEAERAAAALLLDGGLDERVAGIREGLLSLATLCEASLDFDESETGHVPSEELLVHFDSAMEALSEASTWEARRAAPGALARVLLVGAPNAGKSSLWNALTGGEALVSSEAGTTRDALEGGWSLGERVCLLIDGPGLESATAGPMARAQELFARQRAQVELVLWVMDATASEPLVVPERAGLLVWNKVDLPGARAGPGPEGPPSRLPFVRTSASTREGLAELARAVESRLTGHGEEGGSARLLFERHRAALGRSHGALQEARQLLIGGAPLDLVAEALREATASLDELSGRTTSEDVLDRIFARFCLGK